MTSAKTILVGIDTGGTFTDIVVYTGEQFRQCKVLSSPDDPSRAIIEGLDRLGMGDKEFRVIHGTTVGTNAVLEGKGARVAYVTSKGFADVLRLARQNREQVYSLRQPEVDPPVPPGLCFEVTTRIDADGNILECATDAELEALNERLENTDVGAVAINLLFSFLQPAEEIRIEEQLDKDWFVSLSSRVLPEPGEYERGIATWLNASVGPVLRDYLSKLASQLPRAGISVMQSSGTTIAADQAADQAVRLLLSGPAGGLSAALLCGRVTGQTRMLTFDMGGTSTDVSLLNGEMPLSNENRIASWPLCTPSVDIHTIGAGGGSIARVDEGGLLLVGPESAGASPGPACYDQGGNRVTVTDANLVLGRIPESTLLGGYLPLNGKAAARAVDELAGQLGTSRLDAARGVISLANEHMAKALRVMSVERGHDPREYALFCFGGAGGLHACELAGLLEIPKVIMPARAGVLSAQGMLASRPGRELSEAVLTSLSTFDDQSLQSRFDHLKLEAARQLEKDGVAGSEINYQQRMELRYHGQSAGFVLEFIPGQDHAERFHQAHLKASGHRLEFEIELVSLRLGASAAAAMNQLERPSPREATPEPGSVYMADIKGMAALYQRQHLVPGQELSGPAIITEAGSTAWVPAGWTARSDEWGNLAVENHAGQD